MLSDEERRLRQNEAARRWRERNPEKAREAVRAFDARNREKRRAADRARYWADPEKHRAKTRAWQKANPDKHADIEARRRARIRSAPEIEKIDRLALYERDGGRCHVCRKRVPVGRFELDHLDPVAMGGSHVRTNVRVAHRSCNARRNFGQIPAQLLLVG